MENNLNKNKEMENLIHEYKQNNSLKSMQLNNKNFVNIFYKQDIAKNTINVNFFTLSLIIIILLVNISLNNLIRSANIIQYMGIVLFRIIVYLNIIVIKNMLMIIS